jgi:DNA-binding response OmpR family regulator
MVPQQDKKGRPMADSRNTKILIAEDDPKSAQVIRDLLEFEGFRVLTAANGREALDRIAAELVDLVITDFEMPVMNGFELLQMVNRGYPDLPVIMLTGRHREDMEKAISTLKEGAYDYLLKPVDLAKLLKSVITALRISQARKETRTLNDVLSDTLTKLHGKSEKLEELSRIHNDLLKIVSQDLEAPLTILTGSSKMLLKEKNEALSGDQRRLIESICSQGQIIQEIIDDLLDLAVVETDHTAIQKVETELHPIVDKCARNLRPVARSRGVAIQVQPPGRLRTVYVDSPRMKQVFFNLIHQAVQMSERDHTVRIGILPLANEQKVEILFHSRRVPLKQIEQIFSAQEEIRDVDRNMRYRLSLCREIVEQHSGKIWVEQGIEGETLFCTQVPNLFLPEQPG